MEKSENDPVPCHLTVWIHEANLIMLIRFELLSKSYWCSLISTRG